MPQCLALGEGSLIGTKSNKKDHHTSSTDSLYREIIRKKMHPKSLSGSVSSLPDRLDENDSRSHSSMESKKSCSCEHIRSSTPCEHDDCICEICGESLEKRFGKMDGHKMASFYKLWDRPSRQDVVSRPWKDPGPLREWTSTGTVGVIPGRIWERNRSGAQSRIHCTDALIINCL